MNASFPLRFFDLTLTAPTVLRPVSTINRETKSQISSDIIKNKKKKQKKVQPSYLTDLSFSISCPYSQDLG